MTEPGLVMYRFGAALFYANANRFAEEVNCLVGHPPSQVRWLIVDAEAITHLDYSAARVVRKCNRTWRVAELNWALHGCLGDLKADFARHHLTEVIDPSRSSIGCMRHWRLSRDGRALEKLERMALPNRFRLPSGTLCITATVLLLYS